VESNKIRFSILCFFVIYYDFSKNLAEINKKGKDKTTFKTAYNRVREIKRTVSKVEGGGLPGFRVYGGKTDFRKS
jgi:hypothetical protein